MSEIGDAYGRYHEALQNSLEDANHTHHIRDVPSGFPRTYQKQSPIPLLNDIARDPSAPTRRFIVNAQPVCRGGGVVNTETPQQFSGSMEEHEQRVRRFAQCE